MNGVVELLPRIKYSPQSSDKEEKWEVNKSRMDLISFKYYEDSNYDWLIMLANNDIPHLEFEIPDGTIITIPYPLEIALNQYKNQLDNFNVLYGYI
jgi:hypothetical protein